MKNPHGVEPTRFKKRRESQYSIECSSKRGPIFSGKYSNIDISNNCNEENRCSINNDGTKGYECHSQYKSSLFVNTAGPDKINMFSVLDYEVYCLDHYKDYIYMTYKYPDIIWEYIETKDISHESLEQVDDEQALLKDLDAIHCEYNLRSWIAQYFLKNKSELLPGTELVNKQYDAILREWCGDYKWKLLYSALEHEYTAESFHEYCDDKGPTLMIIKSSGGWIFGGYTTQSWSGNSIL